MSSASCTPPTSNTITLSLLTFNILAPCYKKIPHPEQEKFALQENISQARRDEMNKFIAESHDAPKSPHAKSIVYTLESNSRPTYQYRMSLTFNLLGRMARDGNYSAREFLRDISGGIESEAVASDDPVPINLIFLQEFWFGEGQTRSQTFSIPSNLRSQLHITKNEQIQVSSFFHELFKRHLDGYKVFGTQRVKGKMDGVLICFNGGSEQQQNGDDETRPERNSKPLRRNGGNARNGAHSPKAESSKRKNSARTSRSDSTQQIADDAASPTSAATDAFTTMGQPSNPAWELVETRSIRLLGVSNRVGSLCHLRSTQKFTLDESKLKQASGSNEGCSHTEQPKVHHHHIHVVALCTHLTFPHDEHDEHYLRVLQTTSMLEAINECWRDLDPEDHIHPAFKFSVFGGDLNVSAKFFQHNIKEDPVLSLLLKKGYKSIFGAQQFVSHLNHNGEQAPADYLFINRNVTVQKSFLVPQEKPFDEWDEEWSVFSDHRPLHACIELNPQTSCCNFQDEYTVQNA